MTTDFRSPVQKIDSTKLFYLYAKHVFLSIITLSWYRFFTRTEIRRYLWQSLEFDGEPFEYTGRGMDLLIGYLKAILIMFPLYAAWFVVMFMTSGALYGLLVLLGLLAIFFFSSVAYYGALRYRLSRTVHRGIHFGLRGSAWHFGLLGLKHGALSLMTIGFYSPYATHENWAYIVGNMHYGDQNFSYDKSRKVPLGSYALAFILTVFTFGISWNWYHAAITRHCVGSVSLNDLRFRSTLTGGRFFGFSLLNLVLMVVSLGLLYPFIIKRGIKLACETTSLSGELDFTQVYQADAQLGAASEGFVEILGLE